MSKYSTDQVAKSIGSDINNFLLFFAMYICFKLKEVFFFSNHYYRHDFFKFRIILGQLMQY